MDFFSHGLWTGALYKAFNRIKKTSFNIWYAVFWGVFPDILSFLPFFLWSSWQFLEGHELSEFSFKTDEGTYRVSQHFLIFHVVSFFYNMGHSIFIFLLVFFCIWLFRIYFFRIKTLPWELGGWLFHIVIDIATHSDRFFPTPFLWPISDWKLSGISWATQWFLILNYIAIITVYFFLFFRKKS